MTDAEASPQLDAEIKAAVPEILALVRSRAGELDAPELIATLRAKGLTDSALRRAIWQLVRAGQVHLSEERTLSPA